MKNIEKLLRSYKILNEDALSKYLTLISSCDVTDDYTEKHHILPKSIFPQYKNSDWNIVVLTFDKHVEAHRLLCLIYMTGEMKRAYSFISRFSYDEKVANLTKGAFIGNDNPSKRKDVRIKISNSKTGIKRVDMKGKRYFGASDDVVKRGIDSMKEKLKDTVIVRDNDNNRFRVSIDDPRYVNGELVSFNLGVKNTNSASFRPEVVSKMMETRNKNYEKFSKFTFNEMVQFLIDAYNNGKVIFGKKKPFSKNYSGYVKKSNFEESEIYNSVVQRLSKG